LDPFILAIFLLVLSLVLVAVEMFVPSGGVIGTLAVLAAIGAIVLATYAKGLAVGGLFMLAALVLLSASFGLMIKLWPRTALGRRVLLDVHSGDEVLPDDDPRRRLPQLVGHVGRAKSAMLPGGAVEIDGHIYEAVSEGGSIDAGEEVRVTAVRHSRLVVRKAE
jgi:membrane-bound ClpP family serine protease